MSLTTLIIWLVIGAVAGWLAGIIMKGGGFGVVVNIIVGIIGALIGGFLFRLLGIVITSSWFVNALVASVVGAVILLFIVKIIKK